MRPASFLSSSFICHDGLPLSRLRGVVRTESDVVCLTLMYDFILVSVCLWCCAMRLRRLDRYDTLQDINNASVKMSIRDAC